MADERSGPERFLTDAFDFGKAVVTLPLTAVPAMTELARAINGLRAEVNAARTDLERLLVLAETAREDVEGLMRSVGGARADAERLLRELAGMRNQVVKAQEVVTRLAGPMDRMRGMAGTLGLGTGGTGTPGAPPPPGDARR